MSKLNILQSEEFKKWFIKIKDIKTKTIIANKVILLSEEKTKDIKFIAKNIYELRIHYGAGYRLYFSKKDNKIIIILLAGNKDTQKNDIKKSMEILKKYKEIKYEK